MGMLKIIVNLLLIASLSWGDKTLENGFLTVQTGSAKEVQELIEQGALKNNFSINYLLRVSAQYNPHPEVSIALLSAGADVYATNSQWQSPLHLSARYNNPDVTLALLKAGADHYVDIKDRHWLSPLHLSAQNNLNPKMITALTSAGANVNVLNHHKSTPIHYSAQDNPNPEVTLALLKAGANIHAKNINGNSPLHLAVASNPNIQVIKILLEAGAKPQAKNKFGKIPEYYLSRRPDIPLDKKDPAMQEWMSRTPRKGIQPTFKSQVVKLLNNANKPCLSSFL